MFKKVRIHIALSLIAMIWILYADSVREKPINWSSSFNGEHKIPYGTYVLRNLLPEFVKNTQVHDVRIAPYVKLKDSTLKGTYLFVNNVVNFGKEEFDELLKFVKRGNDVFIATYGANVDTLNLKTSRINTFSISESVKLQLSNFHLDTTAISYKTDLDRFGFESIDSLQTEVLGNIKIYKKNEVLDAERINFIRQKFGKGYFYFHLYPHAFTNYYMLKDSTHQYVANVLSYLDDSKPLLWDTYYKTGRSRITSPMYYILNSKNLKWAYYVALLGILIFILFQGKRNQRSIPILRPLKNQTIAFTKTISNLYFERKDHKAIAEKEIFHFLEFIRFQLHIPTEIINESFYKHLASRSGNTLENIRIIFKKIEQIQGVKNISKEQLIEINQAFEDFYQKYQRA